jgi:acyl-CoA reductase-like NAD-dependent aldehyde dehydrogenase
MRPAEAVVVGDPLDEATGIGPVIRQSPFDSRYTSGKR